MRTYLTWCLLFLTCTLVAQPDNWHNPCGFATNDSIDITNDGIPDLVVQGISNGTDDEPSSSGNCTLYVLNLPGTLLLSDLYGSGYRRTKVFAKGDTIQPLDTCRRDDLYVPRLAYADGTVRVGYWGYGHQSSVVTMEPDLRTQRYVFQTKYNGMVWCGSFSIEPQVSLDAVRIRVGNLVAADQAFVVR